MGLEQNADGTWVFTNPAQTFIDPATFSTSDPEFPTVDTTTDDTTEDTTCEEGYIYDNTLKKCVPEVTGYEGQVAAYTDSERDYAKEAQENYVDFREMSYDEMVDFGKKAGFFNAAGTFIGAPDTKVPFPMIKGLAQFGLDSQANRFAINFAKKGGKIWNPNEPSFIGNLYIPPLTKSGTSVWADSMNKILDVKESVTTPVTTLTSAKDIGAYTGGVDYEEQAAIEEEKKQKQEKEEFLTLQPGQSVTDRSGDTYTKKDDGGYTFTPKETKSAVSQKTETGVSYGTGRGGTATQQQQMKKQDTRPKQRDYTKHHAYGL